MSTPLEPGELICFGFSQFDCEARCHDDKVQVDVQMFQGTYHRFTCASHLTRAEIQELTAYKLLDKLQVVKDEIRGYATTHRKRAETGDE